jgi:hypothetical protein
MMPICTRRLRLYRRGLASMVGDILGDSPNYGSLGHRTHILVIINRRIVRALASPTAVSCITSSLSLSSVARSRFQSVSGLQIERLPRAENGECAARIKSRGRAEGIIRDRWTIYVTSRMPQPASRHGNGVRYTFESQNDIVRWCHRIIVVILRHWLSAPPAAHSAARRWLWWKYDLMSDASFLDWSIRKKGVEKTPRRLNF